MGCTASKVAETHASPTVFPIVEHPKELGDTEPKAPTTASASAAPPARAPLRSAFSEEVHDAEVPKGELIEKVDNKQYIVRVSIVRARELMAADRGILRASSDPYVVCDVVLSDGKEMSALQTKYVPQTLDPVWNERFDFNCGIQAPRAVRFRVFDLDVSSAHDAIGHVEYAVTAADLAPHRPHKWLTLKGVKHGAIQVQLQVEAVDPTDPAGKLKLASADRIGLITLRMDAVTGLCPGPLAIKALGPDAWRRGEYTLRAVLGFGLRKFNSKPVGGSVLLALPHEGKAAAAAGSRPGTAGGAPAAPSEGPSVPLGQDLKVWLREGEQGYITQVTLYASATTGPAAGALVPVGRGYADTQLLADGTVHLFHVHLREENERDMDLTDAEQNAMLAAHRGAGAGAGAGAASPGGAAAADAAAVAAAEAVTATIDDGSGFRDTGDASAALEHTASSRGATGEDGAPLARGASDGALSAGSSGGAGALPAGPRSRDTDDLPAEAKRDLLPGRVDPAPAPREHSSGLESALKGTVTAKLTLRGVLESRARLEAWFFARLMREFDADASGALDRTEMLAMLHVLGSTMSVEELGALIAELDTSGDGRLDASELLNWFRSPAFHAIPLAYSLLAFLADGRKGLDELVNDVTRAVSKTDQTTSAGAAILALNEGDKVVLADRGLKIFDRQTGLIMSENIPSAVATAINLMYHSSLGSALTNTGAVRALLKRLSTNEGAKMTTPESRAKIAPFVKLHGINMAECKEERVEAYPHFNAFFYRELKPSARPIAAPLDDGVVVSPADCRMVVYPTLSDATKIWVKGHSFTVESLLGPECADVAPLFLGGSLMLARLAPQDYHRWHLPVTGRLGRRHAIDGALFTVNPIAIRRTHPDVYSENKREVLLVHTKPFGLVAMVAVGATVVGSINIVTPNGAFAEKGACHGYFAFGGSTVLVLFQPGTVAFDTDLLRYSMTPLETYVRVGERVARATGAAGGGGEGVAAGARASAGAAPTPRQGIAEDDVDYAAYAARVAAAAASTGAGGGAGEGKEEA